MSGKVIFWDFDGTLIYPNESFLYALTTSLADAEYTLDEERGRAFLRSTCTWYAPEKAHTDAVGEKWWERFCDKLAVFCVDIGVEPQRVEGIKTQFRRTVCDERCYKVYDDAAEALRLTASAGYENYIISNNFPELSVIAKAFGLDEYISDYVLSSCVGYEKPRREIFEYALELSGRPQDCCMVGDNPIADIAGAGKVGIPAILVNSPGGVSLIEAARQIVGRSAVIRECRPCDAGEIYELNKHEMGYDFPAEETAGKLDWLLASGHDKIFVAEIGGKVVGYVHANDYDLVYAPHMKNIMGIAVSSEYKRCGIGKALLSQVEAWARETGACAVRLVSGETRTGAHEFYRRCGYSCGKRQLNFSKEV